MPKRAWNLYVPLDLVDRVQAVVGDEGVSSWVAEACELRLLGSVKEGREGTERPEGACHADTETDTLAGPCSCGRPGNPCCAFCADSGGARHSIGCDLAWED